MPILVIASKSYDVAEQNFHGLLMVRRVLNRELYDAPGLTGYFRTLEYYWPAFIIGGTAKDFDDQEGPGRLWKARGKPVYNIDFYIPKRRWVDQPFDDLRSYYLDAVRQCFELCTEKARKAKELVDEPRLRHDFEAALHKVATTPITDPLFAIKPPDPKAQEWIRRPQEENYQRFLDYIAQNS